MVSCAELQQLLGAKSVTSFDIVNTFLDQRDCHNNNGFELNGMITTAPRDLILSAARALDLESAWGAVRDPLHGILITIRVCIELPDPSYQRGYQTDGHP